MIRTFIHTGAAALVALAALAGSAAAETSANITEPARPVLKAEATVTGGIVRVGDLVANAGIIANVAIFRAPDLGQTGTVPAEAVVEAVRAHALIGLDTAGISEVVVTRASRAIPVTAIETSVARALSVRFNLGDIKDIKVNFERDPRVIYVEPSANGDPRVAQINFDQRSGRFDATLEVPTGPGRRGLLRLNGRATVTANVLVLSRTIARGALIKNGDLVTERRPRAQLDRDTIIDRAHAIGLAARTTLRSGQPLLSTDLMKPELVQRNETVTLVYRVPGITLTVRGKAIESGTKDDVISVLNEQSKRTIQGVVVGPGRVVISTGSPQLAANLPPSADN